MAQREEENAALTQKPTETRLSPGLMTLYSPNNDRRLIVSHRYLLIRSNGALVEVGLLRRELKPQTSPAAPLVTLTSVATPHPKNTRPSNPDNSIRPRLPATKSPPYWSECRP